MTKKQDKYRVGGEECKKQWWLFLFSNPVHPRDVYSVYKYWIKHAWPDMVKRKHSKRDCN